MKEKDYLAFTKAIQNSNTALIIEMIIQGKDINYTPKNNYTLLCQAILERKDKVIEVLLDKGAHVNPEDEIIIITPLIAAIQMQNIDLINKFIFKLDANLNPTNCYNSPLNAAISSMPSNILANNLINSGAELNPSNHHIASPLVSAIYAQKFAYAVELITFGANVESLGVLESAISITSNIIKYEAIRNSMIACGREKEVTFVESYQFLNFLIKNGVSNSLEYNNESPLKIAKDTEDEGMFNFIKNSFTWKLEHLTAIPIKSLDDFKDLAEISEEMNNYYSDILQYGFNQQTVGLLECALHDKATNIINFLLENNPSMVASLPIGNNQNHLEKLFTRAKVITKFKYSGSDLLLGTQQFGYEGDNTLNIPQIKELSKTYFGKNGKLYYAHSDEVVENIIHTIYALSKHGVLHVIPTGMGVNHSFIIKGKPEQEMYGFGKAVACAGHINIKDGYITYIDNCTGHYESNQDQLRIAAKYLLDKGALSEDIVLHFEFDENNILNQELLFSNLCFEEINTIGIESILENYSEFY